jgi:xanthine dehydrogenase accessory factor
MYTIADQVSRWLAAGKPVTIVRVTQLRGIASRERAEVLAAVPGEPWAETVLGGTLDRQLASALTESGTPRTIELNLADDAARTAGLSCGGTARLLIQPAADFPLDTWSNLVAREPICLTTRLDGDRIGQTTLFTRADMDAADVQIRRLFHTGISATTIEDDLIITALWPTPTLVIVGDGLIAGALAALGDLAGWNTQTADTAHAAKQAIGGLTRADAVVVLSHDRGVDGPALMAALAARPGYVGALGSRRTQDERATWLTANGVTDRAAIHGPAGLDIGAHTPVEIAISIFAEILATRADSAVTPLSDRSGPIH